MDKPTPLRLLHSPSPFGENPNSERALTQPRLIASPNPTTNPNPSMLLGARKRGQPATGDDGYLAAALLGALGLRSFALLELPAPTAGLDAAAAVDPDTGCITVFLGGACVTASPADLAAALALPLGPVALAPEVNAAVFSSAEAIATVRRFVHDRLLLGCGVDVGSLPKEALAALRLVEEGKAYAVDWGRLVWAMLEREVLTGKPRRYSRYLLRLMKCQRPELFSRVDKTLLLGKRRKSLILPQCQRTDVQLVDRSDVVVEEDNLLHVNRGDDQRLGAEVEEGLACGVTKNLGASLIREDSRDGQCLAAEANEEEELVFGVSKNGESLNCGDISYYQCRAAEAGVHDILVSHNIGELEEMPFFGNVKEVPGVVSLDYKTSIVEEGEGVHGMSKGNGGEGDSGVTANYQSSADSSFLSLLRTMDYQFHFSSSHKVFSGTKSQSGPDQQHIIDLEDDEDETGNANVGPSPPVIRTGTSDRASDQNFLSFDACLQQILACVPNMKHAFLDMEKTMTATQAELQHMREELKEKDNILKSTSNDIMEELQARRIKSYQHEQDKQAMWCTFQECKQLFQKSSAAFQEYRNRRCREGGESSSDVITMADGENQISWIQQQRAYETINKFQKHLYAMFSACADKITMMATKMVDLNNEVQSLKNSRSIPDLNKD